MSQNNPVTDMVDERPPSDEELIRLAKRGSLEAFTSLYERYLPVVYNRVRYVVPEQDVEDVCQFDPLQMPQ